MKHLFLLVPLFCSACVGEQTRAAFTFREPAPTMRVAVVDHSAEHEANLQRALDYSIRKQEAEDLREWNATDDPHTPVAFGSAAEPCAVYNLDTATCDSQ